MCVVLALLLSRTFDIYIYIYICILKKLSDVLKALIKDIILENFYGKIKNN